MTMSASNTVRWLFLDLNSYFASVEQQLNPKLRGKPVAVVPMLAETTCAIAASYEAKAFGVKTGTLVRDARRMCPGIQFIEAGHRNYIEFHHKILTAVESCIPIHAVMSIDEMICELTGSQRELENAKRIAYQIKEKLRRDVGEVMTASIGLSTNRFLAKVASDFQKPDGLTVILKSELPQKLYSLPLRDFPGIGSQMEKRLRTAGIFQTQVMCESSKEAMRQIWGGVNGEHFYEWLRGNDTEAPETRTRSISHSHVLPPDLRNAEGAWTVAQKLTHKVAYRLRKENLWCRNVLVSVRLTNGEGLEGKEKFSECQDDFTLMRAVKKIWDEIQQEIAKSMKSASRYANEEKITPFKVSVALHELALGQDHCMSLFEDVRGLKVSESLDEINTKFGKGAVFFGGGGHPDREIAPSRIAFTSIPELDVD